MASQCPDYSQFFCGYWCLCWVCLQSVDEIVDMVALCNLSGQISCWWTICGLHSQYDAEWLTCLLIYTHLVWVCLYIRVLSAQEKVSSHASSQLASHLISLTCHSTVHGEVKSYSETVTKGMADGNSVLHQYSSGTL